MGEAREVHVLVIFSCQTGQVEQLALAAAVGAVQARAQIRLRRIVDAPGPASPLTNRMDQDYVGPREADIAWAEGLVIAVPPHVLPRISSLGSLAGKPAVTLTGCSVADISSTGLRPVDPPADLYPGAEIDRDRARLLGRHLAETVRAGE